MDRRARFRKNEKNRRLFQVGSTLLGNSYLKGFFEGSIYQGRLKTLCLPGLNCYSCPGAIGSCPLGALQNSIADPFQQISFYILGFLVIIGALLGRAVCGFLCPFGLFQDLLGRRAKRHATKPAAIRADQLRRSLKNLILAVCVVVLPFYGLVSTGFGSPTFCKLICPSGTLMAGLPLVALNADLRDVIGVLFGWKVLLLVAFIGLSLLIYRPFCRYVCPLGAIYGFFNKISLYRVTVDRNRCTDCGACTRICPMAAPIPANPDSPECIRCGACAAICPEDAITSGFPKKKESTQVLLAADNTPSENGGPVL